MKPVSTLFSVLIKIVYEILEKNRKLISLLCVSLKSSTNFFIVLLVTREKVLDLVTYPWFKGEIEWSKTQMRKYMFLSHSCVDQSMFFTSFNTFGSLRLYYYSLFFMDRSKRIILSGKRTFVRSRTSFILPN